MIRTMLRSGALVVSAIALFTAAGCSPKAKSVSGTNQPPTVRLTNAPYSSVDLYYYAITLNWIGYDPDGRVDHYLYAVIDPDSIGNADPEAIAVDPRVNWVSTERSEQIILFPSTQSDPDRSYAQDYHIFAIKAVDNSGAESAVQARAFFSKTEAPTVRITGPRPSTQSRAYVTPAVRITWEGEDRDGVFTKKPVKYKYKLLSDQTEVTVNTALVDRDSVRRYYQPRNWAGWDSTSADTTNRQYTNLIPDAEYMFCVIAFDEAGAFSPIFSRDQNMLYFRVTFAGSNNPRIFMFNEFFFYEYPAGSYEPNNPARRVNLELGAGLPVTFNWFAIPVGGSEMRSYRWAVDITDLSDESPRDPNNPNDLAHWSPRNVNNTSATLPPYPGSPTPHVFYLEAEDINGLVSLGMIEFTVVQAAFDKPIGIVKDTRYQVDNQLSGAPNYSAPIGRWPTQAELDTFLFAHGGKPWRQYPVGTISPPGLFRGYKYDTIGTRNGKADQTLRLAALGRYQRIIWIADQQAAQNFSDGNSTSPMGSLRYMTGRNRANTLGAYVRQGGKLWLVGGGAGTSATIEYDRSNNNNPPYGQTFAFTNNELVPGRFMYDVVKWQTAFRDIRAITQVRKTLGRFAAPTANQFYANASLPTTFLQKSSATDPIPPNRSSSLPSDYFPNIFSIEYLADPTDYLEDIDPGPGENFQPALDTLFASVGSVFPPSPALNACMTIYPSRDLTIDPQVIFTGFDIWTWRRVHCKQLVDFVMQNIWGQPFNPDWAANDPIGPGPAGAVLQAQTRPPAPPIQVRPTRPSTTTRAIRTAPRPGRKSGE